MYPQTHLTSIHCPYCGESIDVIIDDCGEDQQYIEDCQVCCRPINFFVQVLENAEIITHVSTDDE